MMFTWSDEFAPEDVVPKNVPQKAGIYLVLAYKNGLRIAQPGQKLTSALPGVVYVGMTGSKNTLQGRFCRLACAWRQNSNQKTPSHGSRHHYNNDPAAQQLFSVSDVRLTYMTLPTSEEAPAVEAYADKLGMTAAEWRKMAGIPLTADRYVEAKEASHIQWFKREFGYIPILNRDDDGGKDPYPDDAFYDKHFADLERRGL